MRSERKFILVSVLIGAILGLGAPLGYFFFSFWLMNPHHVSFANWPAQLMHTNGLTFAYLTVPTIIVFMIFGYYEARKRLESENQRKQMNHFLHVAAHDIKSPLTIIKDGLAMVCENKMGQVDARASKMLKLMHHQSEVMHELITELLDVNKIESGTFKPELKLVALLPIIHKSAKEMLPQVQKASGEYEINIEVPEDTRIKADAFRMRQVFRNLISNASKFMKSESKIKIQILPSKKNKIEIIISNEGKKIPEDMIGKIFNKFTQANIRDYKLGHGLGLAISKDIITFHGGSIRAQNTDPDGVAIHITLPLTKK